MPPRSRLPVNEPAKIRGVSRKRYDAVERQRAELLVRLNQLGAEVRAHPSYNNALILLNQRFRTARIEQRIAILKAADWLINLMNKSLNKGSR